MACISAVWSLPDLSLNGRMLSWRMRRCTAGISEIAVSSRIVTASMRLDFLPLGSRSVVGRRGLPRLAFSFAALVRFIRPSLLSGSRLPKAQDQAGRLRQARHDCEVRAYHRQERLWLRGARTSERFRSV